jgi:hypothetical protein
LRRRRTAATQAWGADLLEVRPPLRIVVLSRRRPMTASSIVFVTLEDG